jgi:hypothetical protein
MNRLQKSVVAIVLMVAPVAPSAFGRQRKPCEELKAEIAKSIEANGVKAYTLTIVPAQEVKESDKVVGSCDGGTKRIVYKRG